MTDLAGQSPTDAAVIEDSWHDPERFALIYHRYFTEIHRYLARRVGTPGADDLAAEVFLTAFAGRERYDLAYSSARPWLYGIATRLLAAHFRQERRFYRTLASAERGVVSPGADDRIADRLDAAATGPAIAAALTALRKDERDVLLLVALADLGYDEVAQALGIPYGTVCSRLNRARTRLRKALGTANPAETPEYPHA